MQTGDGFRIWRLLRWQARNIIIFMSLSVAVVIADELGTDVAGVLPDAPVTVLGAAIGIYVSFRTNAAYDRWWEGRRLWGQLVNTSRHFCQEVLAYLSEEELPGRARALVLRHILYVHALRCELRGEDLLADVDVIRLREECPIHEDPSAPAFCARLLRHQLTALTVHSNEGKLDARRLQSLDQSIAVLLDVQGGCERIRNTPFPPAYGGITEVLIRTHSVLLPLAIIDDVNWWAIPVSIVVSLAFKLISEVGAMLEDPFNSTPDSLPLHALSRTIERNLRDALGDSLLPPPQPDRRGVIM